MIQRYGALLFLIATLMAPSAAHAESDGAVIGYTLTGAPVSAIALTGSLIGGIGGGLSLSTGKSRLAWAVTNDVAAAANVAAAALWGWFDTDLGTNEGGYFRPTIHAMIATHAVAAAANLALGIALHVTHGRAKRVLEAVQPQPLAAIDSRGAPVPGLALRIPF